MFRPVNRIRRVVDRIRPGRRGVVWEKRFGAPSRVYAYSIVRRHDGGYLLLAYGSPSDGTGKKPWLIAVDDGGNVVWDEHYERSGDPVHPQRIVRSPDGGYVMMGYAGGSEDGYLLKVDGDGRREWERERIGYTPEDVIATGDGCVLAVGTVKEDGPEPRAPWLWKLDADGTECWSRTYDDLERDRRWFGEMIDQARSIVEVDDGYAFAGPLGLVAVDDGGAVRWHEHHRDFPHGEVMTAVGDGLVIGGVQPVRVRGEHPAAVVKVDFEGQIRWTREWTYQKVDGLAESDDGVLVVGRWQSGSNLGDIDFGPFGVDYDAWLVSLDDDGTSRWEDHFGGRDYERGSDVVQTPDGGYLLFGTSRVGSDDAVEAMLLKIQGP